MKTKIIVLSLIVLSTLWCADVLAHSSPVRHFVPCTDNDPSVHNEQDKQDCIDDGYRGGHGHVDETHDGTSTGEASSWGYWDACGYAAATGTSTEDCDDITTPPPPPPPPSPPPPPPPPPSTFSMHVISGPGSGAPGAQLTFVVEVRENETAASGQSVTFRITSGDGNATLGTPNPATTGANGQAQTTITLESDASGSYTITATSNGVSTTGTATVTNSDGNGGEGNTPEFSIVVISGPGSGAPGDTLTFVVEVQEDGTATQGGETVDFSITTGDGNASLNPTSDTTDTNGQAQTTITLESDASGSYTITATSNGVSTTGTATVTNSDGNGGEGNTPEFSIVVISGPGSGAPGDTLTFVVEVRKDGVADTNQDQGVTFSVSPNDGNVTLGTTSATADSNGRAQTTLELGASATGSYTITATLNSDSTVSVSGTATVTTSPPPPQYTIVPISGPGSGAPGDTLTFVVEVRKDSAAEPSQGVTFSVSPNDGNVTLGTTSATTGSNGRAQTTLELGASATGSYTITATLNSDSTVSVSGTATVTTSPPPPQYTIVPISGPGSGAPGDTLTFVVEVRKDGAAEPSQGVTFSVSPNDGNVTLGTTSATADSNGRAQTTLELGASATGSYTITATLNSDSTVSVSGTATVTTSPPPPQYTIVPISGPGSGAPGDTLTFVVEVRKDGTAEPNQSVTFSITSGDGNATLGTPNPAATGSDGRAEIDLTLGNNATGSYTITATNNGNSVTGTATVQTSPPDPRFSIVVISGPGSGAPGAQLTFIVEVREDGTATSGETVDFSITAGDGNATLSPSSQTTGSNGQAQTTITLESDATGAYIITATSNGQSVTGTATVTSGDSNGGNGGNGGNGNRNNGGRNNGENNGGSNNRENNAGNNGGGNNGKNSNGEGNNGGGNNQQADILQRGGPRSDEDRLYAFQLNLYAGWNFVHVPLKVTQVDGESMSIATVSDLFQILMPAHMYIHDGSCWIEVLGDSEQALGANQGVAVYMDAPLTVNLVGSPLPTDFSLELGLTFVGLPRQPPSFLRKISDFFTLYPKVCAVLVASEGQLHLVGRAGDSGDVAITGGQAFAFISIEQYMTSFNGAAWGKVLPK